MSMEKKYFLVKLIPPRPSFAFDANDEERKLMAEHAAHWRPYIEKGLIVIFGPVMAKESWGIAIVEADDESVPRKIVEDDPTIKSGRFTYDVAPIAAGFVRKRR
jgi:uncharacterized protein YciI